MYFYLIYHVLLMFLFLHVSKISIEILNETHQFPDSECPSSQECSQQDATAQGQGLIHGNCWNYSLDMTNFGMEFWDVMGY